MHYQAVSAIGTDDALAKLRETGEDTNSPGTCRARRRGRIGCLAARADQVAGSGGQGSSAPRVTSGAAGAVGRAEPPEGASAIWPRAGARVRQRINAQR
jgi:hypothetical protein